MVENIIRLGGKTQPKLASIGEQLVRREKLPAPLRLISSPVLTGGLLGTFGLLTGTFGLLPALGVFGGVPTLAGILKKSPKAEKILREKLLQPEKFGERIGGFIEDPLKPFEEPKKKAKGIIQKIKEKPVIPILGTVGAIAAATALAAPIIKEKLKKVPDLIAPGTIAVTPPISTQPLQALAPVQKAVVEKKTMVGGPIQKPISIKNTFKPSIDISFKKTRRFINQQVVIK